MTRDTSHQQEIQKFSFIESLNLSQVTNSKSKANGKNLSGDRSVNFQPSSSLIVSTSHNATAIDSNFHPSSKTKRLSLEDLVNSAATTKPNLSSKHGYLGRLLFALSCSYSLFVFWWLFGHQLSKIPLALTGSKQIVLSKSEVQFIDYMERSLDKLDRQLSAKKDFSEDEVVLVPVYTPTPAKPQLPEVASPSKPIAIPEPPSFEALKIPAPPPLPEPTSTSNSLVRQEIAATSSEPAISHTLIGILELSASKSAALVKVGGQTKRVEPGEKISDAWILQSVSDRQATIGNGEQVRSVSVGETF